MSRNEAEPVDEVGQALFLALDYVEDAIAERKAMGVAAYNDERWAESDEHKRQVTDMRSFADDVRTASKR